MLVKTKPYNTSKPHSCGYPIPPESSFYALHPRLGLNPPNHAQCVYRRLHTSGPRLGVADIQEHKMRRIYIKSTTHAIAEMRLVGIPDWAIEQFIGREFNVDPSKFEVSLPGNLTRCPTTWSLPPDVVTIVE